MNSETNNRLGRSRVTGVMGQVPLTKGYIALVDDIDYSRAVQYSWHALVGKWGVYAVRKENKRIVYLHRFLMNATENQYVDHKDGNRLDCRRSNLRLCTPQQNQWAFRQKAHEKTSSRFTGVSWCRRDRTWRAHIAIDRKSKALGSFSTEKEAAAAYDKAVLERDRNFIRLNLPDER